MAQAPETARPRTLTHSADVRHLLRRIAIAATPATEARVRGKAVDEAVDLLIEAATHAPAPAAPEFVRTVWTNGSLRYPETTSRQYQTLRATQAEANQAQIELLRHWWLREMVSGPAPVRESLLLFFHGTLGSSTGSTDIPQALHGTNALLRRACLGTIPSLLEQLIADPGMMIQIGMDEHRRGKEPLTDRPGRLVLEHWTVGKGRYAEADARELSRALTGWVTVAPAGHEPPRPVDPDAFRSARRTGLVPVFEASYFESGPKTILGTTRSFDARTAIQFLAQHPATARRFSRLLIAYFGAADPQQRLEDRLVEVYASTNGSIASLVKAIVLSDAFWSAESRWGLIKSPVHLAVGACRQLELTAPPMADLSTWLTAAGQRLFNTPNFGDGGWPGGNAWVTPPDRLAVRYQLPLVLAGRALRFGLDRTAAAERPVRPVSDPWPAARGLSAGALLERLDPAPGVEPNLGGSAEIVERVRAVMATPQYQVA